MERKILVAVDGSVYTSNTIRYLARIFRDVPSAKFHLLSIVPAGALPPGREWLAEAELMNCISGETRRKLLAAENSIKTAIERMTRQGITEGRISSEVKLSRQSIADDILNEARRGLFDALIIGRRGIGMLEEMVIGSTSSVILNKSRDVPVWILDGHIQSRRFLVPVDGSYHCLMAVDHLAHILQDNPHCQVTLFHSSAMFANVCDTSLVDFYERWGQLWCEKHLGRPDSLFHGPKQILMDRGLAKKQIQWLHTFKGFDPSRQILRQAIIDDYGTIVIGRRGKGHKRGIFRGVTDRLVLMSDNIAIWIVG